MWLVTGFVTHGEVDFREVTLGQPWNGRQNSHQWWTINSRFARDLNAWAESFLIQTYKITLLISSGKRLWVLLLYFIPFLVLC